MKFNFQMAFFLQCLTQIQWFYTDHILGKITGQLDFLIVY